MKLSLKVLLTLKMLINSEQKYSTDLVDSNFG